ncbi:hypothetical protein PHJA_001184000 [Phtheirospermum japonicum]|uniref:Uncharacterized protein n=1 Tax=Phtheirospermum japonicum TaxID=374723 RepID=A0A830C817_9LAMI|nr:hypothetical protein PHJA_001184000 [Phtheirospermum japonicum]
MKKLRRKSSHTSRRSSRPEGGGCHRAASIDGGASVADKLEALKNLVPSENNSEIKPDQLFQETADYIVLLKTQVFVLQKLIDFYGSQQPQENRNSV